MNKIWTTKGESKYNSTNNMSSNSMSIKSMSKQKSSKSSKSSLAKKLGKGSLVVIVIVAIVAGLVGVFVVRPAYSLTTNLNDLKKDSEQLQAALANRDLVAFEQALDSTEQNLDELREARDSKIGWAKNVPTLSEYYADSDYFIDAGKHGVAAGREFVVVVEPFADALGLKTSETQAVENGDAPVDEEQGLAEAFSAWVAAMPVVAENSDGIINELTLLGEDLSNVDASKYPEEIRGTPVRPVIEQAQNTLTQLNEYAPDIKTALTIAPSLLGVETGEKRYMIIMQNDKELRATGGFWTYIATFKVNNALLSSDFTSYNSYYVDQVLDQIDAFHTFPTVPAAYERHLKVERMFARDANTSPDLPTSVDQFLEFWTLAQPLEPNAFKDVDGVVVIDTRVLEELLEITGPATVNGVVYSSENVVLELEKLASLALAEQVNRKKILGDMMEQMLINVFESDSNLWPQLVDKGFDLIARKHIAMVFFDPQAQELLSKYNFSGEVVHPVDGDYVFVVSTNLGGDKTNWFVNKEVTHSLSEENGRWKRTVNIKYTYTEPSGEFGPFIKQFKDWVRVYTPQGSELIQVTGSEDVTGSNDELEKTVFDGWITLGPNESKEITFEYYLPDGVVGEEVYNLYIQKQLGIDTEKHTVIVNGNEPVEVMLDRLDEQVELSL